METAFLLIMLTMNGAGETSASFVNMDSQAACEKRARLVESILTKDAKEVTIVESRCVASALRFSKYSRNPAQDMPPYSYLVSLGADGGATIELQAGDSECQAEKARHQAAGGKHYCATSRQELQR